MTDLVRLPCVDEMRGVEDLCVCACTHAVVISHFGPHWSHGAVLDLRGHFQGVMEEQCGGRMDYSGQSPAAAGKDSSLETSVMCVCGGGGGHCLPCATLRTGLHDPRSGLRGSGTAAVG